MSGNFRLEDTSRVKAGSNTDGGVGSPMMSCSTTRGCLLQLTEQFRRYGSLTKRSPTGLSDRLPPRLRETCLYQRPRASVDSSSDCMRPTERGLTAGHW